MKITTWSSINSGEIIQFRYKGVVSKSSEKRTVLVLSPNFRYRKKSTGRIVELLVGLEIDNPTRPRLNPNTLKELFEILDDTQKKTLRGTSTLPTEAILRKMYQDLERFLQSTPIFRTYLLRQCRKYYVFYPETYQNINNTNLKQVSDLIVSGKEDVLERALSDEN